MTDQTRDVAADKTSFVLQRNHVQSDNVEDDYVTALAFSPDSKALAIVNRWGDVEVQEVETGRTRLRHHMRSECWNVGFSPDGKLLTIGCDHGVHVLDARNGDLVKHFAGTGTIFAFAPLAFPRIAIVDQPGDGNMVVLWDLESDSEYRRLGHTHAVTSLAFGPEGEFLAVAAGSLVIWNLFRPTIEQEISALSGWVRWIRDMITVISGDRVHFYRVSPAPHPRVTLEREVTIERALYLPEYAIGPKGKHLLYAGWSGPIKVRALASGEDFLVAQGQLDFDIGAVAYSPNGRYIAAGGELRSGPQPGVVKLWKRSPRLSGQ